LRQLLSGINVVELAEGVAGSYCGKLFADLGAEVVKVESPDGDELRHHESPVQVGDGSFRGGAFLHLNTNKRSTVLDRASADDRKRLGNLLDRSQLVIESTGRGRMEAWGFPWDDLHARSPGVTVVSISGFGATGPYADYQWDDLIAQTMSDALIHSRVGEDPVRLPGHLGLHIVASMAALGALAAVVQAESTGEGCFVDCAATEALAALPYRASTLLSHQYRGGGPGPDLVQVARESLIPGGVQPCADGYVAMMSTPQQLENLLETLNDDN
jgi:crotonobetainyl-CoA:carnitine CoA-transferase CaiB-like acyl-CoA transferase